MTKPVANINDVEFFDWGHGVKFPGMKDAPEGFSAKMGRVSQMVGAEKLGYNVTVVPPGCKAFPHHAHRVNEEMFYIISGAGDLRYGTEHYPLKAGDIICCKPGGEETAHQIRNTSENDDLTYLSVSTTQSPDIVHYPDSGKFLVHATFGINDDGSPDMVRHMDRLGTGLDYWDGED